MLVKSSQLWSNVITLDQTRFKLVLFGTGHYTLLLPSDPCKSGFQAFLCPLTLCFIFSSLFFKALHLQQPSLTFKDLVDPTSNHALLFQSIFSLLWLPKGAHPHLQGFAKKGMPEKVCWRGSVGEGMTEKVQQRRSDKKGMTKKV